MMYYVGAESGQWSHSYNITLALAYYFDYYKKRLHSYYIEEETWSDVGASTPHFTKTRCLHQNTGAL